MALTKGTKERLSVTSIADVAACFGVATSRVSEWIELGMPRTRTTNPEVKNQLYVYNIWEIAPWLRREGPWRYPRGGGGKGENRGRGFTSTLDDETKRVKLAKEMLDLSVKRKQLVDVALIREALLRWSQRRRREIELAEKQFGRSVAAFLNEGLIAEQQAIDNDFPKPEPGTDFMGLGIGSGNGAASKADKPVGGE